MQACGILQSDMSVLVVPMSESTKSAAMPFWKADPRVWLLVISPWLEGSKPWPREVATEDVKWMTDQVRVGHLAKVPGSRTLAKRWSWGHKKARNLLSALDPMNKKRAHLGHTKGTGGAQEGHTEGTPKDEQTQGTEKKGHAEGTGGAQEGHTEGTGGATRVNSQSTEHRAQSTEHRENTPSVDSVEPPASRPIDRVLALAGCDTLDDLAELTKRELQAKRGIGRAAVATAIEALGAAGLQLKPPPPTVGQRGAQFAKAWLEAWKADRGKAYPEAFTSIAVQLGRRAGDLGSHEKIGAAMQLFLREDRLRGVWPQDEASTVAKFLKKAASWQLKAADGGVEPRGKPERAKLSGTEAVLQRLRERRQPRKPERIIIDPEATHGNP